MITLAPAPSPAVAGGFPAELASPLASCTDRSLAAYVQCFALDLTALKGRDVLDVAAGPSSFTAEACARRIDAVAVDPLYDESPAALARRFAGAAGAATQRFLSDYEAQSPYGRYVCGALPQLPFFDGTFDLVLCTLPLFTATLGPDLDWQVAACRELLRVSVGEARIHPWEGSHLRTSSGVARLRRELRASGIASAIQTVDGSASSRGHAMLVLRRGEP
jgi:SAM-dependent methyltransferase